MKTIKQFFVLLLLAVPMLLSGQIYDKDSIFFLERKSLEFGKAITGRSKNESTGFTWRIAAGHFSQSGNRDYFNNPAAVTSLSLEFGYRFQFLEAGFRHLRTGPALGTDFPYTVGSGNPDVSAIYSLSTLVGLMSNLGTARLHIPIKQVPLFVNFGAGHSVFKYSDKFIRQEYHFDGTVDYVYNPTTFTPQQKVKAFTTVYGLGFSKGPFTAGLDWYQLRGKKDGFGNRYKSSFQHMYVGVQMNTSQKRKNLFSKKPDDFNRKRVAIGINRSLQIAPFKKYSGTGTGWTVDASVNLGKRTAILGSYQLKLKAQGYSKVIPQNTTDWVDPGTNIAGKIGRHLLYAGTSLNPESALQLYVYYGGGYYYSIVKDSGIIIDPFFPTPVEESFKRAGGAVMGTGFHYKYIHSQVLLHKTFSNTPVILEWNLGGRMLF